MMILQSNILYADPAFAFRLDCKSLEPVDNTQEVLTLADSEEIVVPADHREFREPAGDR